MQCGNMFAQSTDTPVKTRTAAWHR